MSVSGVGHQLLVPPLQVALEVVFLRGAVITEGASVRPLACVCPQVDGQLGGCLAVFATVAAAVVRALVLVGDIVKRREEVRGRGVAYICGDGMGLPWRRVAHVQTGHGLRHQPQGHASVAAHALQEIKQPQSA